MKEKSSSQKSSQQGKSAPSAGRDGVAIAPPGYEVDAQPVSGLAIQRKADPSSASGESPNRTGLPDALKSGIESLSGLAMDDVRVHTNSSKPAQLQALAYTQGTDIHVGPGQERHLPHEAWHVVQQKQGRVKPTMQMKGAQINDNIDLEKEADRMGAKATLTSAGAAPVQKMSNTRQSAKCFTVQRAVKVAGGSFDTKAYSSYFWDKKVAARKEYGAKIILEFTPDAKLGANDDTVSLVQSVADKMTITKKKMNKSGKAENVETFPWKENKTSGFDLRMTDSGAIDHQLYNAKGNLINLDPRYAEERTNENDPMKARPKGDLSTLEKDGGNLKQGHVFSANKSDDVWNTAVLSDEPTIPITVGELKGTQEFEVAALYEPENGSPAFVGSVKWGWKVDNGKVSIMPLAEADGGKASGDFLEAAKAWNEMEIPSKRGDNKSEKKSVVKKLPIA